LVKNLLFTPSALVLWNTVPLPLPYEERGRLRNTAHGTPPQVGFRKGSVGNLSPVPNGRQELRKIFLGEATPYGGCIATRRQ
jgi:hypothetical protein